MKGCMLFGSLVGSDCYSSSAYYYIYIFFSSRLLSSSSRYCLPSPIFWTSRGHRCRPSPPPVRAFLFLVHRAAFSISLLIDFFIECCEHMLSRLRF